MKLFGFLYVDEKVNAPKPAEPVRVGPKRNTSPMMSVLLENTEKGTTISWGEDGMDIRGIKEKFPVNASTGGAVMDGIRFVGSFSARVTGQSGDVLSLAFTETDKGLKKRLTGGAVSKGR